MQNVQSEKNTNLWRTIQWIFLLSLAPIGQAILKKIKVMTIPHMTFMSDAWATINRNYSAILATLQITSYALGV